MGEWAGGWLPGPRLQLRRPAVHCIRLPTCRAWPLTVPETSSRWRPIDICLPAVPAVPAVQVLMIQGFLAVRKHADRILLLVEMMQGRQSLLVFRSFVL